MMPPHIMVFAGAGTGKTFCVTEGVHRQVGNPRKTVGSDEQQTIWDAMTDDPYPGRIHMTSFTNDASDQLANLGPKGHNGKPLASSSSTFSMGLHVAKKCGHAGHVDIFDAKYKSLTTEFLGGTRKDTTDTFPKVWNSIYETQKFARLGLKKMMTRQEVKDLAAHQGIDLADGYGPEGSPLIDTVVEGINAVLHAGREKTWMYDFTDMVYMPVMHGLVRKVYDTLVIDEAQDMGVAQQELCMQIGHRLIIIGDPHQAIYGFAGADTAAFKRFGSWLGMTQRGTVEYPLTLTRRCSQAVVREANRFDPNLQALPTAPEGKFVRSSKSDFFQMFLPQILSSYGGPLKLSPAHLMICCPTNAPLISLVFRLQKCGIKAFIQGGDLTKSMIKFVDKHAPLKRDLLVGIEKQIESLMERKYSKSRDIQIDIMTALQDITNECATCDAVKLSISNMFSDSPRPGWIRLSSIHKAKGLEAHTVVIWEIDKCKSRYSVRPWQHEQDRNLEHVAITRAKHNSYAVSS